VTHSRERLWWWLGAAVSLNLVAVVLNLINVTHDERQPVSAVVLALEAAAAACFIGLLVTWWRRRTAVRRADAQNSSQ
jgi:NADH:ubiquinone oxidoreductase subunit K